MLFLSYPKTCETIVNAFRCYELQDGSEYLLSDFNIECSATYKALMFPAAFSSLVVYAVGVPSTFLWRLYLHREVLQAPGPRWCLGFLYRDYEEKYYYFECVELVRKFLLVSRGYVKGKLVALRSFV